MNKNVIVITGPTASGKTDFSLKLADSADVEIVSADSRQIYRYMNIGTAKPSEKERSKVIHHLVDCFNPDEEFSAGKFAEVSKEIINDIIERGKIPVVSGGTGFYIKALFDGISYEEEFEFEKRKEIREELNQILLDNGKDYLYYILLNSDPEAAYKYYDKNPRRIFRALEYIKITGKKFSDTFGHENSSGFNPQYYVLNPPRAELYNRINRRTEMMYNDGLLKEVTELLEKGFSPVLNSLNTVGYKECLSLIFGEVNLERAIELTKQNTRRYAKRQVTWLNQIREYKLITNTEKTTINNILTTFYT